MKTVNFLGQDWEVPDWANYITQDRFGDIDDWENFPSLSGRDYNTKGGRVHLGRVPCLSVCEKI